MDDYLKLNKAWWDKATSIHADSKLYDLEGWKKGKSNLMPIELEEVGDVKGKTLLHLQCHFGMGTIDWARKGAIATGVDLSEESIKLAKQLSEEVGVPAEFICSNIYDLPEALDEKFDIVFTSYGVLAWLPDLKKWAEVINNFLKTGGAFYIVDIHPFTEVFNHEFQMVYSYFEKEPFVSDSAGTYTDRNADIKSTTYEWNHTMSEILNALREEGLKIEFVHEFPFTVYDQFPGSMEKDDQRYYHFRDKNIGIPLLFSIKATK